MSKKKKPTTRVKRDTTDIDSIKAKLESLLETPETEDEVVELLFPFTDDQRRQLTPLCRKNHRKVKKNEWIEIDERTSAGNPLMPVARTAVFCSAVTFSDIKTLGPWELPKRTVILDVLRARKPTWVGNLVEMLLNSQGYFAYWRLIRTLVREGLCERPDNPRYYTGMA